MKGRRFIWVFAVILVAWLVCLSMRARGSSGSKLIGASSAIAINKPPAAHQVSVPPRKPIELVAANAAPSRLFVSSGELQVPTGLRLMVFTPHPDDEALGASGLIERVLDKDGMAQVVYMTNGDGFVDGVIYELGRMETSTDDFIEYGEQRHDEAVRAMGAVGLGPGDSVFLGFPDGGIDDLWSDNWSKSSPYTSPTTQFDRPPYKECPTKTLKYSGTNLVEAITRTMRAFEPDWIVLPDPRDKHPDHYTAGLFVLEALRKLKQEKVDAFTHTQVLTYLIHFPDYPMSSGWVNRVKTAGLGGVGPPCPILSSTQWLNLPLTSEELEGKRLALTAYKSQMLMMGGFFQLFMHPYEIFGRLDSEQIMVMPEIYAAHTRSNG